MDTDTNGQPDDYAQCHADAFAFLNRYGYFNANALAHSYANRHGQQVADAVAYAHAHTETNTGRDRHGSARYTSGHRHIASDRHGGRWYTDSGPAFGDGRAYVDAGPDLDAGTRLSQVLAVHPVRNVREKEGSVRAIELITGRMLLLSMPATVTLVLGIFATLRGGWLLAAPDSLSVSVYGRAFEAAPSFAWGLLFVAVGVGQVWASLNGRRPMVMVDALSAALWMFTAVLFGHMWRSPVWTTFLGFALFSILAAVMNAARED